MTSYKELQQQLNPREEPESIEADRVGGWREPNQPRRINNKRNRGYRRESFPNIEQPEDEQEKKKLLGSQLIDNLYGRVGEIGQSIVKASEDDPDTWTDDMIRLGLGGAKNVGNVLNAPGIRHALQALGAPAWVVGQGLGWTLEKAGVDPRYGHIAGEVGEWFIPFYGAGKLVKAAGTSAKKIRAISKADEIMRTRKLQLATDLRMSIDGFDDLRNANLLNQQPWFQKLDAFEQQRLIDDLPQLVSDARRSPDDPLSTGFRTALGRSSIGETTGRRLIDDAEVMRYSEMRQVSSDLPNKGRDWLQIYMTDKYSDLNTFGQQRIRRLPELRQEFAELIEAFPDLGRQVQIHHIAALKGTMGIFDGLQKGSPLYRDVANQLLKHIPGLGDEGSNLLGVVGASRRSGTPHGLVHAFYREIIGEAGELFFTPEVLTRMRYDRTFRLQKADELGRIIAESEDIVRRAQVILAQRQRPDISIYDVIERISPRDFQRLIDLPNRPRTDQIIENAIQREALDWYNQVDPNMLKDQNLDKLRDAQKAINSEITTTSLRSDRLPDTTSTEQLNRLEAYLERLKEQSQIIKGQIETLEYN